MCAGMLVCEPAGLSLGSSFMCVVLERFVCNVTFIFIYFYLFVVVWSDLEEVH